MKYHKPLLQWQLSNYGDYHRSGLNLAIHLVTIPVVWLSTVYLLVSLFAGDLAAAGLSLLGILLPYAFQGLGHSREGNAPEPFLSPLDFFLRFLAEQYVTFPRWLLRGRP